MTELAREALLEVDSLILRLDEEEEVLRKRWYNRTLRRIKRARKGLLTAKKNYRVCTIIEEDIIDYLERYNEKHRWMSPRGTELLEKWANSGFWRDPGYYERVPESLVGRSRIRTQSEGKVDWLGEK